MSVFAYFARPRSGHVRACFWGTYVVLAAVALAVAWKLFPLAIPLVNLDVKLARDDALTRAEALGSKLKLVPEGARSAARFRHDDAVQNYVELEGGGKPAFAALVAGTLYSPYWWEVRLFKPGAIEEATIRFRPDGKVYGLSGQVAETWIPPDAARLALDADAARSIAEASAISEWGADFDGYQLIEQTQRRRTTGRVDHGFVYERTSGNIGESRFRLRLEVAGDTLTDVLHFVEIPESFTRRYTELRSANNTIAAAASLLAGVLYGVGGCLIGVLWLLRRHWLLWRPALVAGLVVGTLMGATLIAAMPAAWFGFDTAQAADTFVMRQIGAAVLVAVGGGLGYALVFMAAEGLSRRAFGDHPQLWRVWTLEAAPSWQVLGRTLGGYLFVPIELALVAAFYYATNRWLGWWQPSEALTDPNILGSALPALQPIAVSLQAGFMEECVFRAVPLSLAALIGARFGRRGLAVGIAVVVQALIFGAAHANYPGFPPYSRLVELIVPSFIWALIFLRFGLVPTIILHAVFDLALFAIPIFLVDAPGGRLQQAIVIGAGLVPLAIVLARRAASGRWHDLAPDLRNGAWQPDAQPEAHAAPAVAPTVVNAWAATFQRALPILGAAGLIAWIAFTPHQADVPALSQRRAEAIAAADAVLAARGVVLGEEWHRAAVPKLALEDDTQKMWHKFVWRVAGPDTYRRLIGNSLASPVWEVRYAKFDGDVAERAEEWNVTIDPDGAPRVVQHALPEARAGATLARDAARTLAVEELARRFRIEPGTLTDVGAEEKKRPARTDWTFTFTDPRVNVGEGGEARFLVAVAGDEISTAGRYIHVPETWQRTERERDGQRAVFRMAVGGLFTLLALAALVLAVLDWTKGRVDRRALIGTAAIVFVATAAGVANRWPQIAMNLNTAEPVASQVAIAVLGALFGGLLLALLCGLIAGVGIFAARQHAGAKLATFLPPWLAGAAAALFAAGVNAILDGLAPRMMPLWPGHEFAAAGWPPVAAALAGIQVLVSAVIVIYVLRLLARLTGEFTRRAGMVFGILALAAASTALIRGSGVGAALTTGIVEAMLVYLVVYALWRFDVRTVPALVGAAAVLRTIQSAVLYDAPAVWFDAAISIAAAVVVAYLLTRYLDARDAVSAPSPTAG